jgi:hypothetical protein
MANADETPQRFELQPAVLRRQRRILARALAWYLAGGILPAGCRTCS